jgi:hypothetical protein
MVEEDDYVHDGWLKRMGMCMATVWEDGFVPGRKLERMVMSMADGCRGWLCVYGRQLEMTIMPMLAGSCP